MTGHEWKVLASFGLLVGAISIFDPSSAKYVVGVAIAVVVVRNAGKIPAVADLRGSAPVAPQATHTLYV